MWMVILLVVCYYVEYICCSLVMIGIKNVEIQSLGLLTLVSASLYGPQWLLSGVECLGGGFGVTISKKCWICVGPLSGSSHSYHLKQVPVLWNAGPHNPHQISHILLEPTTQPLSRIHKVCLSRGPHICSAIATTP